jgi:signal transduction histidine kinase
VTSLQVEDLPWRRRRTLSPVVVDVALLGLLVVLPAILVLFEPPGGQGSQRESVLLSGALSVPLILLRRRWPIPTAVAAVVATVVVMSAADDLVPAILAITTFAVLYTMATLTERRTAWLVGLGSVVTLYVAQQVAFPEPVVNAPALALGAWLGLAVAAGDAVRNRRSYMAAMEDRVRRNEEVREEESRRRVVEERLRIARELHDVVAHRMTVITVQVAAAASQLRRDPDGAAASLEIVRSSASTVLDELGGVLRVLRSADDEGAPAEPTPSLADLDVLVDTFADAGLEVRRAVSGRPRPMSDASQLAAFRVVQEALTNAHKHGVGRADLSMAWSDGRLQIDVENPAEERAQGDSGSGLGLMGMHERVAAAGGTLEASVVGPGRFRVAASLPTIPREDR